MERRYFNREISYLSFNRRVLEQAINADYPLLERLKYLSFVSSNLDEFFGIRVAGLIQQYHTPNQRTGLEEQLKTIGETTRQLVDDQYHCWQNILIPALAREKIFFKSHLCLTPAEAEWVKTYYENQIYPILTPLAIDPAHPFPQFTNKALNILIALQHTTQKTAKKKMAVIPVPRILPRVLRIEVDTAQGGPTYIFISDIIRLFAQRLFPGYCVLGAWAFRITRNSDLYIDEEYTQSLIEEIEEGLLKLDKGAAVRLEIEKGVDADLLLHLLGALELEHQFVFQVDGPPNLIRLMSLYDAIDRPDLKFKPFIPRIPSCLKQPEKIFEAISQQDILLHHPYDSFNPVVEFIQQAAQDPHVLAIKQTLYRTSGDSPIVSALAEASKNGKQVTALIELKARFDEANNIHWARQLEEVGVHVVYGLVGLKTHCKACLVVRKEDDCLKRYVHLGSGNYNPKTAKTYTDISFFTAQSIITEEVAALFNTLTGLAATPLFAHLLVAPFNLHQRFIQLIQTEAKHAQAGQPSYIFVKLNSLVDETIIEALYAASQAGVKIDLLVRGACGLVPGVKNQSENITVRSLLGRFLEHSRLYYFLNHGGESLLMAGSADWMSRNFFRRIEAAFPITDPQLKKRVTDIWIPQFLADTAGTSILDAEGRYHPVRNPSSSFCVQSYLIEPPQKAIP